MEKKSIAGRKKTFNAFVDGRQNREKTGWYGNKERANAQKDGREMTRIMTISDPF